jgi:hypothetical protein
MIMKIILSIFYIIIMIFIYIIMIKRLKSLTNKHIRITEVSSIENWYKILVRIIFIFICVDVGLSVFLILTLL